MSRRVNDRRFLRVTAMIIKSHQCRCGQCDPALDPTGPRRGEHHFAVRLGDAALIVHKDGELILDCYEIDLHAGQARRLTQPIHRCRRCRQHQSGICTYIDTGEFSISNRQPTR